MKPFPRTANSTPFIRFCDFLSLFSFILMDLPLHVQVVSIKWAWGLSKASRDRSNGGFYSLYWKVHLQIKYNLKVCPWEAKSRVLLQLIKI